jgi:heterodisulfide reductase subunit A
MPESKKIIEAAAARNSEEVRVGVYTCHCGDNISHVVQCERVAGVLGQLPDVVVSRTDPSFCSDAGQAIIEQDIKEKGINRVVIGACAPSLHEQTFRNTLIRAGLNPYLYHHVGIREQDSWVHSDDPEGATRKAIHLMAAGLAKARLLSPLDPIRLKAEKRSLVIGGGVAGLKAALDIARQGIHVTLVEKSPFLGGRMAQLESIFPTDENPRDLLRSLIREVTTHPGITIFTQAEVTGVSGYVGNFNVRVTQHARGVSEETAGELMAACAQKTSDEFNYGLTQRKAIYRPYPGCYPALPAVDWKVYDGKPIGLNGKSVVLKDVPQIHELTIGAIVLATGFDPYEPRPGEYGYGEIPEVVTLPQLIRILAGIKDGEPLKWNGRTVRDMALIHCVGSREIDGVDEPHEDGQINSYCSRVCCTASLHTAVELRKRFPRMNLYEFFQDIRTYGRGHEEIYRQALASMVRFLRYHGEERPRISAAAAGDTHPVLVQVKDYLTGGGEVETPADLVVLAVGMMPRRIDDLVNMVKVSRGTDRFLLEVHPKLRPVEMAVRGIVLAGTAQGPMNIQESLSAASAAAAKVSSLLGQGRVELPPFVARVDESRCDGTGICAAACPEEGAIAIRTLQENEREVKRAVITPANCTGCGACVGACPNRAIDIQAWTLAQYEAMVDAIAMDIPFMAEDEK